MLAEPRIIEIPVTRRIIKAGRPGDLERCPLALAITRGIDTVEDVDTGDRENCVVRTDGQVEEYGVSPAVDGWITYWYIGDRVTRGTLYLRTATDDQGRIERSASFVEDRGKPTIRWDDRGPYLSD